MYIAGVRSMELGCSRSSLPTTTVSALTISAGRWSDESSQNEISRGIRRRKACSLRRCGVARTEIWAVDCSGDAAVFAADHLDTDRSSRTWGTRNGSLPVAPEAKRIADAAFGREEGSVNSGGR